MDEKRCGKCQQTKFASEFHMDMTTRSGLACYCKRCTKQEARKYYIANRERVIATGLRYRSDDPRKRQALMRKRNYGLDDAAYQAMFVHQKGLCGVCELRMVKTPCVDHDHLTGAVRGLLCRSCNLGVGHLKDSPILVERALEYLT